MSSQPSSSSSKKTSSTKVSDSGSATTTTGVSTSTSSSNSSASFAFTGPAFTQPFPSPSGGPGLPGTSGGNNQNQNQNQQQSPLQSSATLYLYTFLATLVLLLGVSAAIVFRSLILRRRHRRMIEEAIRNGTWIPPTSGRIRVDPSKKPVLHEAYLGGGLAEGKRMSHGDPAHEEWEGIMPFSVSYTASTSEQPQTLGGLPWAAPLPSPTSNATPARQFLRSAWNRLSLLRRNIGSGSVGEYNSTPMTPLPSARTPVTANPLLSPATPGAATAAAGTSPSTPTALASASPTAPPAPAVTPIHRPLRVSVLIVMPSRTPLQSLTKAKPPSPGQLEDEEELPLLEIGVTEVVPVGGEDTDSVIERGKGRASEESK